jgi:NADH-quinone oxidoreductase subunit I
MLGNLMGLVITLVEFFKPVVTAQYPKEHLPLAPRFMGFPALTWDQDVGEPYCTGCMVCVRYCPTQCMSATMTDNPLFQEDKSKRRKIVGEFEINLGRCILCGICVDVCNFDAIEMSHEHELSVFVRNGNRATKERLLEMGWDHQQKTGWKPAAAAEEASEEASA